MSAQRQTPAGLAEKLNRMHRRVQIAEAALDAMDKAKLKELSRSGGSIGRALGRAYAYAVARHLKLALDRCRDCNGERSCTACREAAEWLL